MMSLPSLLPALQLRSLTRRFGRLVAVDALDLDVQPGEIVGFLGPNGAGKTTTLGMVAGLLRPDEGEIQLLGQDGRHPTARRGVGFLVGPPALWPGLTGLDHLRHGGRIIQASGWKGHGGKAGWAPEELLALVGLEARDGRRPVREYSQGMRQRLGLAMALVGRPSLLVLDEPTNGLDPLGGPDVWAVLRQAAGEGVAVLVSTHLLLEVEHYCDRAPMLVKGRLAHSDVLSLLKDPQRPRWTEFEFATAEDAQKAAAVWLERGLNEGVARGGEVLRWDVAPEAIPDLLMALAGRGVALPRRVEPVTSSLSDLFTHLARQTGGSIPIPAGE